MKPKNLIISTVSILTIGAFIMTSLTFADEDSQDLKQQVQELQQKVTELEKALQAKGSSIYRHYPIRRWEPFSEMNRIQEEMNSMFQGSFSRGFGSGKFGFSGLFNPDEDIHETDNQYVIKLDLPGMEKSNINVEIQGNQMVISGEKKNSMETDDKANRYYKKERSVGYFSRSVSLPENADKNNIHTEYKNGVLTVKINKLAASKIAVRNKIKIN